MDVTMNSASKYERIAPRVLILDAQELDTEIYNILKHQFDNIISYLPPGTLSNYAPELEMLIKLFLWTMSVEKNHATFGQQLLHLKYNSNCSLKCLRLYGLLSIGSGYLKERLWYFLGSHQTNFQKINEYLAYVEKMLKMLNILSFIIFLRNGESPTILERLLRVSTVSVASKSRKIGYTFMTRELLWHGFIEMFVFILPLINYHALKRRLKKLLPLSYKPKLVQRSQQSLEFTYSTKCSLCREVPILPYHMGCSHIFCYYCLHSQKLADIKFECPECGYTNPSTSAPKEVVVQSLRAE